MFRRKTTFVIGAGASYEFGLPVGTELARRIKKSALIRNPGSTKPSYGDQFFFETFKRIYHGNHPQRRQAFEALDTIHNGIHTAVSIDAFIHRFRDDPMIAEMGKMLIALEIIKAERGSTMEKARWKDLEENELTRKSTKHFPPDDVWIGQFLRILLDGVEDPREIGHGVNIICFNYDRCIEYYLRQSIAAAYRLSLADAQEIVEGMNIIHPYGTLGDLALVDGAFGQDGKLSFAPDLSDWLYLEQIAKNIRTYTEQVRDIKTVHTIHEAMADNRVLVFMGFGFNNQNLDLLRLKGVSGDYNTAPRNIYATGVGIAAQVRTTLERRVYNLFVSEEDHDKWEGRLQMEFGLSCSGLFDTHNVNLSSFSERYVTGVDEPRVIRYRERPKRSSA